MHLRHLIFTLILTIHFYHADAQLYIGFSGDLGNRVGSEPHRGPLFKRPLAPSGSVTFVKQEEIRNERCLQYGGAAGVLGYSIKVADADTLSYHPDFYNIYPNYNTIYVSANLCFGRQFLVKGKKSSVFLGGGVISIPSNPDPEAVPALRPGVPVRKFLNMKWS